MQYLKETPGHNLLPDPGDGLTSQRKEQDNSGFAENVDSDENDEQDKSGDVTNKTESKGKHIVVV